MRLWPFGRKEKRRGSPSGTPPPRKKSKVKRSAADIRKEQVELWKSKVALAQLKRKYDEVKTGRDTDDDEDDDVTLTQLTKINKQLKPFGFRIVNAKDGKDMDGDDSMEGTARKLARDFGEGAGRALVSLFQPSGAPAPVPTVTAITAPAAPQSPQPPAKPQPLPMDGPPALESAWLINRLKSKTPEQGALWFVNQNNQDIQAFVTQLCETPDGQLPSMIQGLASRSPALIGFVNWLFEGWDTWTLPAIDAMRQIRTNQGQAAGGV